MKKIEVKSLLAMLLALTMLLSFAACGKPDETTVPSDSTDTAETDPVEIIPPETDPSEDTDPVETDPPIVTDPAETDPKYDPIETEPPVTDPIETDPVVTDEPEETLPPSAGGDHEHIYRREIVVYPSCLSDGVEAMVCSYCGHAKDHKPIDGAGHSAAVVEAAIVSFTHHTAMVGQCQICEKILYVDEYLEEHTFISEEVVADEVTDGGYVAFGYEIFVCEGEVSAGQTCGYTLYVNSNASDGHCYIADEESGQMVCRCGKIATADVKYNQNPNAGVQIFATN